MPCIKQWEKFHYFLWQDFNSNTKRALAYDLIRSLAPPPPYPHRCRIHAMVMLRYLRCNVFDKESKITDQLLQH